MEKKLPAIIAGAYLILVAGGVVLAGDDALEYPCYIVDAYDADESCWTGMDPQGRYEGPIRVVPEQWLVGPPLSEKSGVTLPPDHWVEVQFRGPIIDGPGDDIIIIELGPVSEQARVFLTDGQNHEYLLGLATAGSIGTGVDPTQIGFDISGVSLPFVPRAVRILGIDTGGQAPGFDVANVRARIGTDCGTAACNPIPVDGAKNVGTDAVLNWSPGDIAEGHIVHLSTELSSLDADMPAGSGPQDANTFNPWGLELGTTYYWRMDEVNDPCTWTGNVWSFTTADHLVIDDFESYRTADQTDPNSKWVHEVWIDPGVYLSTDPTHGCGKQAMALSLFYYHTSTYSEAVRTFDAPQDWTKIGARVLELYFLGGNQNSTGQMYLALYDGTMEKLVLYPGDANDITKALWQPWRIELQNLDGVNLSHIQSIGIGLAAEADDPYGSGSGTLFFDDIALYSSRCLQENMPPVDLNADCLIDFRDFDEMALDWLETGRRVYPAAAPRPPLAWYKFDGDAADSAGAAHGQLRGSPTFEQGVYGQAIRLDGHKNAVEIADATSLFSTISTGITIAFWQYGADSPYHTDTLCCSNYRYGQERPAIAINLGCWRQPGRYNWDCGQPWSFAGRLSENHRYKSEWSGRWNHWAFTKDALAGEMKVFLNGELCARRAGANSPISGITSFEIGSGWYGGYDGLIDDFCIYDYALSQPEIVYAATAGTGVFDLPLLVPADLNADNRVDFFDFARLAEHWLENRLWP